MLNAIYMLLPQDVIDFTALNALPENSQGPQVSPMAYENNNSKSSVIVDLTGTAGESVPAGFIFSTNPTTAVWVVLGNLVMKDGVLIIELDEKSSPTPVVFDEQGNAKGIYAEAAAPGAIIGTAKTLTGIIIPSPDVSSITNPDDAVVSGSTCEPCVDKTTIDDPKYKPWADAMEANQSIATRKIIIVTVG